MGSLLILNWSETETGWSFWIKVDGLLQLQFVSPEKLTIDSKKLLFCRDSTWIQNEDHNRLKLRTETDQHQEVMRNFGPDQDPKF